MPGGQDRVNFKQLNVILGTVEESQVLWARWDEACSSQHGPQMSFLVSTFCSRRHLPLSVQFSLVAQSCPTLCNPMTHSMPGLPVHHQLPESTQTRVHQVDDAMQPSHPLSSPSPPALSLSNRMWSTGNGKGMGNYFSILALRTP